jgi:hypothetical protein
MISTIRQRSTMHLRKPVTRFGALRSWNSAVLPRTRRAEFRRRSSHTRRPPDLKGFWTNGTIAPLQRPPEIATKEFLSPEEAARFERTALPRRETTSPERANQRPIDAETASSDAPETRTLDERCLLGVAAGSSSAAPPMPNPINATSIRSFRHRIT